MIFDSILNFYFQDHRGKCGQYNEDEECCLGCYRYHVGLLLAISYILSICSIVLYIENYIQGYYYYESKEVNIISVVAVNFMCLVFVLMIVLQVFFDSNKISYTLFVYIWVFSICIISNINYGENWAVMANLFICVTEVVFLTTLYIWSIIRTCYGVKHGDNLCEYVECPCNPGLCTTLSTKSVTDDKGSTQTTQSVESDIMSEV